MMRAGNRAGAGEACLRALASKSSQASTWSNLSAFALMTGNLDAAQTRACRALQQAPDCVDAMVNLSAATFAKGDGEEALAMLRDAVRLRPRHPKALANLGLLLRAHGEFDEAEAILGRAAAENPGSAPIALERALAAQECRDSQVTQGLALAALVRIAAKLPDKLVLKQRQAKLSVGDARIALHDAQLALQAAGQPFYLMAGTLLGLVRDGDLMSHDKDIDLALPYESDRDAVAALFLESGYFSVPRRPEVPANDPLWAFGVVHDASGITIDLFFARNEPDGVRFGFGLAPRQVFGKVRPFQIGTLEWSGRQWPVPMPPEQYLEDIYGADWRRPDPYFDTVLSNSCRCPESLPRAINHGLLRLADALKNGDWLRAHSLCRQLLAREPMVEISAIDDLLSQRCAELSA